MGSWISPPKQHPIFWGFSGCAEKDASPARQGAVSWGRAGAASSTAAAATWRPASATACTAPALLQGWHPHRAQGTPPNCRAASAGPASWTRQHSHRRLWRPESPAAWPTRPTAPAQLLSLPPHLSRRYPWSAPDLTARYMHPVPACLVLAQEAARHWLSGGPALGRETAAAVGSPWRHPFAPAVSAADALGGRRRDGERVFQGLTAVCPGRRALRRRPAARMRAHELASAAATQKGPPRPCCAWTPPPPPARHTVLIRPKFQD